MTTPSELNPSARVTRLESPVASPGQCGICGKASHLQGFSDPRLDFEFYGSLIFCRDCAGDISSVFGFLAPEDFVGMREHIAAQDKELNTLRQAVLGLESAVEGLSNYRDAYGIPSEHKRNSDERAAVEESDKESEATEPDVQEPDGVPAEPVNAGADEDEPVNESAEQQGRNDVLGATGVNVNELLNL